MAIKVMITKDGLLVPKDVAERALGEDQDEVEIVEVPEEVFAGIRSKCAAEWPADYNMCRYCEQQQFDSYRELEEGYR